MDEAKASARYLPISTKHAYEVCNAIKGKEVKKAIALLKDVMAMKRAIEFKRYNREVPHRKGKMMAGRYPVKACKYILPVLENAIANAKYLNLDESRLFVKNVRSNKGVSRERGSKYTHLDIIVAEKNDNKVSK